MGNGILIEVGDDERRFEKSYQQIKADLQEIDACLTGMNEFCRSNEKISASTAESTDSMNAANPSPQGKQDQSSELEKNIVDFFNSYEKFKKVIFLLMRRCADLFEEFL
jgi:superoxide dismutase